MYNEEKAGTVYYSEPNRIILFYQDAEVSAEYTAVGYFDHNDEFLKAVIQNLKDAGCAPNIIKGCIACMEQGKKKELLKRLEEHRNGLLYKVHKVKLVSKNEFCIEEKQIDCLDYRFREIYLLAAAEEEESTVEGAVKGLSGRTRCFPKAHFAGTVFGGGADF